jgi:hypothetical protein
MIQLLRRKALRLPVMRRGGDWGVSIVSETKVFDTLSGIEKSPRRLSLTMYFNGASFVLTLFK